MRLRHAALSASLAIGLAVATTTPSHAAWPTVPTSAFPVSGTGISFESHAVPDGNGGAFVFWSNYSDNYRAYATRITAAGTVAPGWPAGGFPVGIPSPSSVTFGFLATPDDSGGAFVTWGDGRSGTDFVYLQHVRANGTLYPGWPIGGIQANVPDVVGDFGLDMVTDGAGGVIVVWEFRYGGGDYDIYGARFSGTGALLWRGPIENSVTNEDDARLCSDGANGAYMAYLVGPYGAARARILRLGPLGTITAGPVDVTTSSGTESGVRVIADGKGGAIAAWTDDRSSPGGAIYAERWTPTLSTVWSGGPADAVGYGSNSRSLAALCSDGANGAFVVWYDDRDPPGDTYAQHMLPSGGIAPGWVTSGDRIAPSGSSTVAIPDSLGGMVLDWKDYRSGGWELYALRVLGNGSLAPGYPYDGTLVRANDLQQHDVSLVTDRAGGGIAVWDEEAYYGLGGGLGLAQRIDRVGALGDATPHIVSVRDVANDQGGQLRVAWNGSYLDADPTYGIGSYRIWEQVPVTAATARMARGARLLDPSANDLRVGDLASVAGFFWSLAGTQPAVGYPAYAYVIPTATDSVAGSNPRTVVKIQAVGTAGPQVWWDSAADSGYAVDNLPPATPTPFTAHAVSGVTTLSWGANTESDLAGYRLYRGASAGFVPGAGNLIADKPQPGFSDIGPVGAYYKLAAYDTHGNLSPFAVLGPNGILAADGPLPRELAFELTSGNPSRGSVRLRLALPATAPVRVEVFDALGRRVRTLADGAFAAGVHELAWDGAAADGRSTASGLYFVRLVTPERTFERRVVAVR